MYNLCIVLKAVSKTGNNRQPQIGNRLKVGSGVALPEANKISKNQKPTLYHIYGLRTGSYIHIDMWIHGVDAEV